MMIIENNNFVYQTEKGQKNIIAPEMRITNYTEHIPTGIYENEIEIEFFKCITNGEIVKNKFIIKASQFADIKEFVSVCSKNGCLITPNYVNYVFIFLTNNLRSMIQSNSNILYKHNVLGYHKYKEITHFFWDKTKIDGTNISCYAKPQVSFVQGNEQEYFRMIKKYVCINVNLSLALIIGLSSVVNALLFDKTSLGVPIYVFSGKSSTGKTLAATLAISSFMDCNPITSPLMTKLNASTLGLYAQLQSKNGLPICLDDVANTYKGNIANEIYGLASGTPRTVSSVTSEPITREGWRGTLIMTTETCLLDYQEKKSGLSVRIIDLNGIQWTNSAQECDEIREIITSNYGFMGIKFANYITNNKTDRIFDDFKKCKTYISENLSKTDDFSSRVSDKYASLYLTCLYYNELFPDYIIDEEKILDLLVKKEESLLKARDSEEECYQALYEYCSKYKKNFDYDSKNIYGETFFSPCTGQCFGKWVDGDIEYISISVTTLKDIMIKIQFPQYKNYINKWKDLGYLKLYKDDKIITNNKKYGRCYTFIYTHKEEIEDSGNSLPACSTDSTSNKDNNNIVSNKTIPVEEFVFDDSKLIDALFDEDEETNDNSKEDSNDVDEQNNQIQDENNIESQNNIDYNYNTEIDCNMINDEINDEITGTDC